MKARHPVARHLRQLSADSSAPIALPLKDRSGPLACQQLLRLQPGSRAAFHGHYGALEVIAKLYFHRSRHAAMARQELNGLLALADSGCETPPLLYTGAASDDAVSLLLLAWLPGAVSVRRIWPQLTNDTDRRQLLCTAADVLARQHLGGVSYPSLQLDHLLWFERRIVCIDGNEVRRQHGPLSAADGLANFARFCGQFAPRYDALLADAFTAYQRQRFGAVSRDWPRFAAAVQQVRRERLQQQLHAGTRPVGTLTGDRHGPWQSLRPQRPLSATLAAAVADPDSLKLPVPVRGRVSCQTLTDGESAIAVTRYPGRASWQRLLRPWQLSPAQQAFRFALCLREWELAATAPVAAVTWQQGPLVGDSYLFESAGQQESLASAILRDPDHGSAVLIPALVSLLTELHALQLWHRQLGLDCLVLDAGKLRLTDLHELVHTRSNGTLRRRYRQGLTRLLAELDPQPALQRQLQQALLTAGLLPATEPVQTG